MSVSQSKIIMAKRRKRGFPVDGVLLLDKPPVLTSNGALQEAKHMLFAQKAGHTGSLDPLATGLLPLCFGHATKISQFLLGSNKSYRVKIKLGETTNSGDSEGEVLLARPVTASLAEVQAAVASFLGEYDQVPPMFSALKVNGVPLYKLARQGIEIERKPRRVTAFRLDVLSFDDDVLEMDLDCSSGYYVRSLAMDVGEKLGCGGHVIELRRTAVASLSVEDAVTLEQIKEMGSPKDREAVLISVDAALQHLPRLDLPENVGFYFLNGQAVKVPDSAVEIDLSGHVRVFVTAGFVGLGEITDEKKLKLVRAFNASENANT